MIATEKACILNAHNGIGWYPKGQQRLINSLTHQGFGWDVLALQAKAQPYGWDMGVDVLSPNAGYKSDWPYTLKAAAFEYAIYKGYEVILWLDCSAWAIKNPEPVMRVIADQGYYLWKSGFTLGQTCGDHCLKYFGITRQEAHSILDAASGGMGIDMRHPIGQEFAHQFIKAAKDGMFHGSRDQLPRPKDGQLFYHRQDQSVAACIAHKLGMQVAYPEAYMAYANELGEYPDSVYFVYQGM